MAFGKSIRWQLPLSYAAIALIAALALGSVLIITLRGFYGEREYMHLNNNARAISGMIAQMTAARRSDLLGQSQLDNLAFLAESRVRLLSPEGEVILDTGSPQSHHFLAFEEQTRMGFEGGETVVEGQLAMPVFDTFLPSEAARGGGDALLRLLPRQESTFVSVNDDVPYIAGSAQAGSVALNVERALPGPFDRFTIAVSGTPYGLGLGITNDAFGRRSSWTIQEPIYDIDNQLMAYVELSEGPAYGTELVDSVARTLVVALIIALVIAFTVGYLVSLRLTRPLLALNNAAHQMAEGALSTRADLKRSDEIGALAQTFNHMAHRVEEMVTTLRRFVADAAHELHTPLTIIYANLELALSETDPEAQRAFVARALAQVKRLENLTNDLLDLSRLEGTKQRDLRTSVDLNTVIRDVSELYASRAEQKELSFSLSLPDGPVMAMVNETQFRRVLSNLLDNAIKFTPEMGDIDVGLRREGGCLRLWVKDTGIGIPAEDLPHLFNRFHRARNAATTPGSGLGLAIIRTIVEAHGGAVQVESQATGTAFWLQLPLPA